MRDWTKNPDIVTRCAISFDCVEKALQMLVAVELPVILQRNAYVPKPMQTKLKTIGLPAVKAAKLECERILVPGGPNGHLTSAGSTLLEEWNPLALDDPASMTNGPSASSVLKWLATIHKWVEKHFAFFIGSSTTSSASASFSDLDVQMGAFESAQRECLLPQLTTLILLAWLARTDMSKDKLACSPVSLTEMICNAMPSLSQESSRKGKGKGKEPAAAQEDVDGGGGGEKEKQSCSEKDQLLIKIGRKAVATELVQCAASVVRSSANVHPLERRRKPVLDKVSDVVSHPLASDLIGFVDEKGQVRFADPVVLSTATTPYDGFLPASIHREVAKRKFCFSAISEEEAVRAVGVPIFAMFNAEEHDVPAFLRRVADHIDGMEPGAFRHMAAEDKWPMWSHDTMTDDDRAQQLDQRIAHLQKHMEALHKERNDLAA